MSKINGFEQREALGDAYWNDPRWKRKAALEKGAIQLRKKNLLKESETLWGAAQYLLTEIHVYWGV